jgi:putative ABC transport system permease protein
MGFSGGRHRGLSGICSGLASRGHRRHRGLSLPVFSCAHAASGPLLAPHGSDYLFIRIEATDAGATLASIESVWDELFTDWPLTYTFLDDDYRNLYANEARFGNVFGLFTLVALFIACLGLFGLAAFSAERRTKEMGIRKVLGASAGQIIGLMSRDMAKLVIVANLIAWPVAWYTASRWLETYPFRTSLALWVFAVGSLAALAVAWFSISFQALRASRADPVTSLRYE